MAWLASFSVLSVCGLLLAAYSRDEDARLLALALVALALSAWPAWYGGILYLLAIIDLMIWCCSLVMWDVRQARWLAAFWKLASARMALHVAIGLAPSTVAFLHALNATFVLQIYLVSRQGGIRLGDHLTDRVRRCHARNLRALQASPVRLTAHG